MTATTPDTSAAEKPTQKKDNTLKQQGFFIQVAIPVPLRSLFHYLPQKGMTAQAIQPGVRVEVPFGRRRLTAVVVAMDRYCPVPVERLKTIDSLLDTVPVIQSPIMALCQWCAQYYHYSLGEILAQALPKTLRQGKPMANQVINAWQLSTPADEALAARFKRRPKQWQALNLLAQADNRCLSENQLRQAGIQKAILTRLAAEQLISPRQIRAPHRHFSDITPVCQQPPLTLNPEQQQALNQILINQSLFFPALLDGITGSGKTEVYLQAIAAVLKNKKQALVLIPEIGLTPQTVERFQKRFNTPVVCLHSGLSDGERLHNWQQAACETAGILIATRSGIFTPLPSLGLIIVDEEHDSAYKQHDTLRYNARDLAIYRARQVGCPVVLGSATASLETYYNAIRGRFNHLQLTRRAGSAALPHMELMDIRGQPLQDGLSARLIEQMAWHLGQGNQVMVFLNRRGYAPSVICHDCGTVIDCPHCDAHMTLHRQPAHMHCHHCDHKEPIPRQCPACQSGNLQPAGQGTERTEQTLVQRFPGYPVIRIDRDSTQKKNALAGMLDSIHSGQPCILLGTQMLAKGHHFPSVTLVAILNADGGLFSADFRGLERTGQLIVQVAGRAGRSDKPGQVIIQSHNPQHPALKCLTGHDYSLFSEMLLQERSTLNLPPLSYLALVRMEAHDSRACEQPLRQLRQQLHALPDCQQVRLLGPLPAPMEKRQGRYRWQLILQSSRRSSLHGIVDTTVTFLESLRLARTVRWSIDIDPQEMV